MKRSRSPSRFTRWLCAKAGCTSPSSCASALSRATVSLFVPCIRARAHVYHPVTTAVFATCGMSVWRFLISATIGLPKQLAAVYLGDNQSGTGCKSIPPLEAHTLTELGFQRPRARARSSRSPSCSSPSPLPSSRCATSAARWTRSKAASSTPAAKLGTSCPSDPRRPFDIGLTRRHGVSPNLGKQRCSRRPTVAPRSAYLRAASVRLRAHQSLHPWTRLYITPPTPPLPTQRWLPSRAARAPCASPPARARTRRAMRSVRAWTRSSSRKATGAVPASRGSCERVVGLRGGLRAMPC